MPTTLLSRLKGLYFASAVGDALGASVEFFRWRPEPVRHYAANPHFQTPTAPVPAGSFTDDTSLSLALLDALLAHTAEQLADGQLDTGRVLDNMSRWAFGGQYSAVPAAGAFDIGNQTFTVLQAWHHHGQAPSDMPQALGNGAIVRVHICTLFARDYATDTPSAALLALNRQQVACTHPNATQYQHAEWVLRLLWALLRSGTMAPGDIPKHYADKAAALRAVIPPEVMTQALATDPRDITGHVTDTLHGALVAFAQTDSLEDCLIAAASYYGDSDSVCALEGFGWGVLRLRRHPQSLAHRPAKP